jgi:type II secretory pathway pseudopilin PulG
MRGFTMIEAVLCVAVIGAAAVGTLAAYQGSLTASLLTDQQITALNIARETMEEVIAQRDCNKAGCGYAATLISINASSYSANPVSGFSGFVLTTTATEVRADSTNSSDSFLTAQVGSGYARVNVAVSWNGGTKYISLVTIIANY